MVFRWRHTAGSQVSKPNTPTTACVLWKQPGLGARKPGTATSSLCNQESSPVCLSFQVLIL